MITTVRLPKLLIAGLSILLLMMTFIFTPANANANLAQDVSKTAKKYIGVKYKEGGTTPNGFDASGYTQYVFDQSKADIQLPRKSKDQFKAGTAVKKNEWKEGDLLFFKTNGKTISFVGIYLGNDQFIAATVSKGVSIQSVKSKYWKDSYAGAKRVLK